MNAKEQLKKAYEKTTEFIKKYWKATATGVAAVAAIVVSHVIGREKGYDSGFEEGLIYGEMHNPEITPDGCEGADFSWGDIQSSRHMTLREMLRFCEPHGLREDDLNDRTLDMLDDEVLAVGVFTKPKDE